MLSHDNDEMLQVQYYGLLRFKSSARAPVLLRREIRDEPISLAGRELYEISFFIYRLLKLIFRRLQSDLSRYTEKIFEHSNKIFQVARQLHAKLGGDRGRPLLFADCFARARRRVPRSGTKITRSVIIFYILKSPPDSLLDQLTVTYPVYLSRACTFLNIYINYSYITRQQCGTLQHRHHQSKYSLTLQSHYRLHLDMAYGCGVSKSISIAAPIIVFMVADSYQSDVRFGRHSKRV